MSEPGAPPPDPDADDVDVDVDAEVDADVGDEAGSTSELDKALGRLKRDGTDADDRSVSSDARTRMSWSSVTEADPESGPTTEAPTHGTSDPSESSESSFRFDLGSALARVGDPPRPVEPPAPDEPPAAAPSAPPVPPATPPPPSAPAAVEPPASSPTPTDAPTPTPTPHPTSPPAAATPPITPPAPPAHAVDDLPRRDPPSGDELPRRGAPTPLPADQLPRRRSPAVQSADELPQRRASAPADGLTGGRTDGVAAPSAPPSRPEADPTITTTDRSVFDNANPAPSLPRNPQRSPSSEPTAPVLPAATTAALPTLPASNPAAPPPVVESPTTPSGPDVHAVRSFELKAQRERRRSRFIALTFLVLALLAGAVAVALLFGRSWLFPTQWSEDLIPIVDEIELEYGAEFSEPVALEELPVGEYAAVALEATFGDDWAAAYPQWRALGLASGSVDSPALADAVAAWRPAVYDAESGVIYRVAGAIPTDATDSTSNNTDADAESFGVDAADDTSTATMSADDALRVALLEAFNDQRGIGPTDVEGSVGITGVSSLRDIAARAVDRALLLGSTDVPTIDADEQFALPLLYEMIAIDVFGEPIIAVADLDPAPMYGDDYPDEVLDALVTDHPAATLGSLPDDAEPVGEPAALGPDAWALVWQNRLPEPTTVRLRALITADVYQPFVRGGTGCVAAAFETESDISAGEVVTALTAWATAAPIEASPSISISTVNPAQVEFVTCDPGATAQQSVAPSTVTNLIERQLAALD